MIACYSSMETFSMWFCVIFLGGIWLALIMGYLGLLIEWKSLKKQKEYTRESEPSNDFIIERDRVLELIQERMGEETDSSIFLKDDFKAFRNLKDSSELASLFRYAHLGGCYLTFEQDECNWKDDPEYFNSRVFKTDLGEAYALLEEKKWSRYKRYHDPPKSPRERAMGR